MIILFLYILKIFNFNFS